MKRVCNVSDHSLFHARIPRDSRMSLYNGESASV